MQPITVLHLVHRLTVGGAERVLVNVVNGTSDRIRHLICSFFPPDDFASSIRSERCQVICLGKKEGNDWAAPMKLARICRKYGVDVVHSQGWATYAEGVIAAKLLSRNPRFVFAFRGKTAADVQSVPFRRRCAQKAFAKLCDGILTPSYQMRDEYAGTIGIDPRRITVIYNGVDVKAFSPRREMLADRRAFGFSEGNQVIGCIARMDPVKNLAALIHAFELCRKNNPNSRLLLVGDGPQHKELKALVENLHLQAYVCFTGRRNDIPNCLRAMDIYVQPSLYEGMSNTLLEAMSCGLPVVARSVGGTPELITHGKTGVLMKNADPSELSFALQSLLGAREVCGSMGNEARAKAKERFTLEAMITGYEGFFLRVGNSR